MKVLLPYIGLLVFLLSTSWSAAQPPNLEIEERKLVETKWKYTYALHLESNTIIHQAEEAYEYFLYFRYNNTYVQFLNGKFSRGNWKLKKETLQYKFKHIKKFTIAAITSQVLVLEFTQANSKGTYQYHFTKASEEEAPFIKPINELPLVKVEVENPNASKRKWWAFPKRKKRKKSSNNQPKKQLTYINIELTGGGFYGGINPVYRDFIHIKNDGRLIREFKSEENGLITTKRTIPRTELERFAQSIVDKGFFNMERLYTCETHICEKRKARKPSPIPLRIAVAYGDRRKVITISIFGKDDRKMKYVDYPIALDQIIATIQNMVHRLDAS